MRSIIRFTSLQWSFRIVLFLLSIALLSACVTPAAGLIPSDGARSGSAKSTGLSLLPKPKMKLRVMVAPDANHQSPVALDLLMIYNKTLLKTLSNITASEWFEKRHQFRQDYPVGKGGFESWKWEWVPGQSIPMQRLKLTAKAKGGLIFADYFSPGEHRARIPRKNRNISIELLKTHFTVQSSKR